MSSRRIVLFSALTTALLASVFVARRATAVATNPIPVTVDPVGRSASGGMGTARNTTTDGNQEISCWSQASGPTLSVSCFAVDKNGNVGACSYSTNPNTGLTLGGIGAITENAAISFQWDANGTCTLVTITNDAYLEPKLP